MDGDNVSSQSLEESIRLRPENLLASAVVCHEERLIATTDLISLCVESFPCSPIMSHLFLEILSNAVDNYDKSKRSNIDPGVIRVRVDPLTNEVSVYNEGIPFSCKFLEAERIYNPQAAIFTLLTSTNYGTDDLERTSSGRNGVGGASVSLFTTRTTLRIRNAATSVEYVQESFDCLRRLEAPIITPYSGTQSSTEITYVIDMASVFRDSDITHYSPQMVQWMAKSCMEAAASSGCSISFNGVEYRYPTLKSFTDLILAAHGSSPSVNHIEIEKEEYDTRIVVYDTPFSGISCGYVNGIPNPKGGAHVDAVVSRIVQRAKEFECAPKLGKITTPALMRHLTVFVMCKVPSIYISFDGQRKEKLVCPKYRVAFNKKDDKAFDAIEDWNAIDAMLKLVSAKLYKDVDGKKTYFMNVEGYTGAEEAGGKLSHMCTLNVVEGKSTVNSVVKGIDNKYEGVYAVGGKILNTSKCNDTNKTEEQCMAVKLASKKIGNLIKILGLKIGTDYSDDKNMQGLRYHRVRLLTDEDVDGYHIQGLFYNMMRDIFPSLFQRDGFICVGNTPLIRLEGTTKEFAKTQFYSLEDYEMWRTEHPDVKHSVQYFKGLGSNSDKHIADAFKNMKNKVYRYDEMADQFMCLAFDSFQEDNRKTWIASYDRERVQRVLDPMTISGFINTYLMQYNMALVARSIPSIVDGLKPSQRKILYTAMRMPNKKELTKCIVFMGKVMDFTHYHHGDASLYDAMVGMISSYTGLNNYPLLQGSGQFGTIASTEPSSCRYTDITNPHDNPHMKFFSEEDDVLLQYQFEGNERIEPKHYVPIVPIFALNGGSAIAIGWSTDYPPHHIDNVIDWIKVYLINRNDPTAAIPYPVLVPHYKDYKGKVRRVARAKADGGKRRCYWVTEGRFTHNPKTGKTQVIAFPVGMTFEAYSKKLDKKKEHYEKSKKKLDYKMSARKVTEKNGDITVLPYCVIKGFENPTKTSLGLRSKVNDINIKLLDENGRVMAFDTMASAMMYWCDFRYRMYERRIQKQSELLNQQLETLKLRARFISCILDDTIDVKKFKTLSSSGIKSLLERHGFPIEFMSTNFSSMTKESHDRMLAKIRATEERLAYYRDSSVTRVWVDDLDSLSSIK